MAYNKKKPVSTRKRDPNLAKIIDEIKEDEEKERKKKKDTKVKEDIELLEDQPKVKIKVIKEEPLVEVKKEVKKETKKEIKKEPKKTETKKVKEEKKEVIEDIIDEPIVEKKNEVKEEKPVIKEENKKGIVIFASLIALISFVAFIIIKLPNKDYFKDINHLVNLGVVFLITIGLIVIGLKNSNKKLNKFIILVLLLLTGFNTFNILVEKNVIKINNGDKYVLNFYNKPITDVYDWNKNKNILINETYEFSDIIPMYNVISQDVAPNTPIKDINVINLIISNGPNYDLETIVPSFMGWEYDTVIDYLEKNFLNNVDITFEKSNNKENTVISQEGSGSRKRNDLIKLVFAISEINETEIIDLSGYSRIKAIGWLAQHGFKYELDYQNDDNINKDYVITNSDIGETKDPETDIIKVTISKGKIIKAPDFKTMSQNDINKWIMDNNLKVTYVEKYNEETNLGDVIDSSAKPDEILEAGSKVTITISKGKLEMPKIENIDSFKIWASENKVDYQVNYDFSDTVKAGDIITCSHSTGDAIKENDTVRITVSKGKSITVPNFVGMSQNDAKSKCNSLGLSCTVRDGSYSDKYSKGTVMSQSQKSGAKVASSANITLSISKGAEPKVTVPNFVGQTKSTIQSKCNSIGIKCNFTYQSSFSSTAKDTCVSQSKTGTVTKGTTITITLSKGPARTYKLVIDSNYIKQYQGNPNGAKSALQSLLKTKCPGATFNITFKKQNFNIGLIHIDSPIKADTQYTITEGKTYNIIIAN